MDGARCSLVTSPRALTMRHSLLTFRLLPDMLTKLQLSSSDEGRQKLQNIYASYSTLGGATYFNAIRSSIKQESGAQAAQSSDGTKIQNKEILCFTFIL